MTDIVISGEVVRKTLPLMAVVDRDGKVVDAGRTLSKLSPGLVGQDIGEAMRIVRPSVPATYHHILARAGRKLGIELLQEAGEASLGEGPTTLRCVPLPLNDGRCLLLFTLGADPTRALRRHRLTAQDFFETDPIVDFLFLQEAHAIVLAEFERLSERLDAARAAAEEEAVTDKLTGLRNRRAMDLLIDRLRRQDGARFALMQLDLDYFKTVNDTLGHAAGDRVLEVVAGILRDVTRRGDMVARVGGDEFMLVFVHTSDVARLQAIAGRIIEQLERPIVWDGHICRISGSIGIAVSTAYDPVDPVRMIADADNALYDCKREGRARFKVAEPQEPQRDAG